MLITACMLPERCKPSRYTIVSYPSLHVHVQCMYVCVCVMYEHVLSPKLCWEQIAFCIQLLHAIFLLASSLKKHKEPRNAPDTGTYYAYYISMPPKVYIRIELYMYWYQYSPTILQIVPDKNSVDWNALLTCRY